MFLNQFQGALFIQRGYEVSDELTNHLHTMSSLEIVELMNEHDSTIAEVVQGALPEIARAVDLISKKINLGGRLFYLGAGTSGRLGVMDAAECVPTFGTEPESVQGIIAGGSEAAEQAKEDAEDYFEDGEEILKTKNLTPDDVVVGLAASGKTPFVIGSISYANSVGSNTVGIACTVPSNLLEKVDIPIGLPVGPEVLEGSTRLKAGTAQKMVLNMLSTASMVQLGKVYQNLMVDVKPKNRKLLNRAKNIVMKLTDVGEAEAKKYLKDSGNDVKVAIVMARKQLDQETARNFLNHHHGYLGKILNEI